MNPPDCVDPTTRERMRRIADTWRMLEPSAAEIAAARARFVVDPRRQRPLRAMPGTLAVAIVLVGSAAFAGARVVWTHVVAARTPPVASADASMLLPSVAPSSLPRAGASARPPPSTRQDPLPVPPAEGAPITVDVNDLPAATLSPTPGRPPASPEPSRAAGAGTVATPSRWSEAADALRAGDYARAERAFDDLVRSDNPRTRDEARLARAQVWIAEGRTAEARPELASLAATGAAALVRERAADALGRLP